VGEAQPATTIETSTRIIPRAKFRLAFIFSPYSLFVIVILVVGRLYVTSCMSTV
jgi:hypothetical protein